MNNNDGIDHINIYSQGKTQLGRLLSNWTDCDLNISLGYFKNIECLIFFLGSFNDSIRYMSGYIAKTKGNKLDRNIRLPEDIFKKNIIEAMNYKVQNNETLKSLLIQSDLPLTHYYVYNGKIINVDNWEWQVQEWEKIRIELKNVR